MRLARFLPQDLRARLRELRFAWRNARFVPTTVSKNLDGVRFEFLLGDVTGREWYEKQNRLSPELAFLRDRMAKPGDIVLEAGAHHGFTTILIAHWIGPAGRVTAFEASPSSAEILGENIRRNDLQQRVTVEAKAVGSKAGVLSMSAESNAFPVPGRARGGVSVPIVPLDDVAGLEPTLVKLDVEGFEIEALRGATRILARRPKVAIEVHVDMLARYGHGADELFQYVRPSDHDLWLQLGVDQVPRPYAGERLSDQHMDQVHLYAIPKGTAS